MIFRSLTDNNIKATFAEAITQGLASDAGLYFPETITKLSDEIFARLTSMNQQEVAAVMLEQFVSDEISETDFKTIVQKAVNFETPVKKIAGKNVLELFHGPTLAFKDVGARFLAAFIGHFAEKTGRTATVLVATSGDTGGGIAQAFSGVKNTKVVILFPKGRVSALQYEQLTRAADNVESLEISGSFDDCQDYVKRAFNDVDLKSLNLTSANSINVGRLLPQTTYYGNSYASINSDDIRVVVPTGNLGNLTAAVLAKRMGIPFKSFVAANNNNDALHRYIETGKYNPKQSVNTLSNAMDVGDPNNLPRLEYLFGNDFRKLQQQVESAVIDDKQTTKTIVDVYEKHGYLLDPHTAVAWAASDMLKNDSVQDLIVATASPLKFADEITKVTGIKIDNSRELEALKARPAQVKQMESDYHNFKSYLLEF